MVFVVDKMVASGSQLTNTILQINPKSDSKGSPTNAMTTVTEEVNINDV